MSLLTPPTNPSIPGINSSRGQQNEVLDSGILDLLRSKTQGPRGETFVFANHALLHRTEKCPLEPRCDLETSRVDHRLNLATTPPVPGIPLVTTTNL